MMGGCVEMEVSSCPRHEQGLGNNPNEDLHRVSVELARSMTKVYEQHRITVVQHVAIKTFSLSNFQFEKAM
ncbi:unnamed protein product [Brassica rapa subsp. narinosa]